MIHVFRKMYADPSNGLTLEIAKKIDKAGGSLSSHQFDKDCYRQPVLAEPIARIQPYRRGTSPQVPMGGSVNYESSSVVNDESQVGSDKGSSSGKFV